MRDRMNLGMEEILWPFHLHELALLDALVCWPVIGMVQKNKAHHTQALQSMCSLVLANYVGECVLQPIQRTKSPITDCTISTVLASVLFFIVVHGS